MHKDKSKRVKLPLARFALICADPPNLGRDLLARTLGHMLTTVRTGHTSFVAIVERAEEMQKPQVEDWSHGKLPGRIIYDSVQRVEAVLETKYRHELSVVRYPGHKSHVPEQVLVPEKLVIVVGSPYFLANHIELYLERTGTLRRTVFPCMKQLMLLKPCHEATGKDECYLVIEISNESFYAGNFDAYIESVEKARVRLTTEDLQNIGIAFDTEHAESF